VADQLERVVRYKPTALRLSFAFWTVSMPFVAFPFAVMWFACAMWFLVSLVQIPFGDDQLRAILFLAFALVPLSAALGALLSITAVAGDDQIHISRDGIVFPLFMSPFLRFRRRRLWSEVSRVFIESKDENVVLLFRSGEKIRLNKRGFEAVGKGLDNELEKFILACEVLATDAEIAPEVLELRDSMNEVGKLSYTEIWENELTNRFHATVFVPLEPDTVLRGGQLKVIRQLAFGGLAAVYLVQKDGRELMILKEAVIPANQDEQIKKKAIEMFEREARLLAALEHPRIAKVFDHFVEQDRNYLLLERITGQNLRQLVSSKGPQPEPQVLKWSREIVELLAYLHEQNPPIIHRDLTPENLILADSGEIYLIDFGAANQFLGTVTGTVVGKQAFIAPEQFRGKANLSSDIYAFGGTIHFILTGKNPLAMSVASPRSVRPDVSLELDALVSSCTSLETDNRPKSARDLLVLIENLDAKPASVK